MNYHGFDFSPVRIAEARRYVPAFQFSVADVFAAEAAALFARAEVVVLTEVLEHIERDRDVLQMIPAGALVLFSVPNFDSAGHVRTFDSMEAVRNRYSGLLRIESDRVIPKPTRPHKVTFVCRASVCHDPRR